MTYSKLLMIKLQTLFIFQVIYNNQQFSNLFLYIPLNYKLFKKNSCPTEIFKFTAKKWFNGFFFLDYEVI